MQNDTAWFSPQPESDPTTNALIKKALYSRTLHLIGSRHEQTKPPENTPAQDSITRSSE